MLSTVITGLFAVTHSGAKVIPRKAVFAAAVAIVTAVAEAPLSIIFIILLLTDSDVVAYSIGLVPE